MYKKGKPRVQRRGRGTVQELASSIPRPLPLARSIRAKLTFVALLSFPGGVLAFRMCTNTVHDPFRSTVAEPTANKTQYFLQFLSFKVLGYDLRIDLQNESLDTIQAYLLNVNSDPGTSVTDYPAKSNNPLCQSKLIAPANAGTNSMMHYRARHRIPQINGNMVATLGDDTWSGSGAGLGVSTSDPVDKTWFGLGIVSPNTVLVTGLVRVTFDVIFWDRYSATV